MAKKTAVATTARATLTQEVEATLALATAMSQDAGTGFEEAGREAYALPFLTILQDLSPQVKKKMSGYVQGATPGMIYHTVTLELAESVRVIPCHYSQLFIEWVPREKGGGFVAAHPPTTPLARQTVRDERNNNVLPNGNYLVDTRQHFVCLLRDDGTTDGCMLAMKSSNLKVSRRWMSQMRSSTVKHPDGRTLPAPMFAYSYRMGVEERANDQGSWYVWKEMDQQPVSRLQLYEAAKTFGSMMKTNPPKAAFDDEADPVARDTGRGGGDIPGDFDDDNALDA